MYSYHISYSSAPVSPATPSPMVGRGAFPFWGDERGEPLRVDQHRQPSAEQSRTSQPAVRQAESLRRLAQEPSRLLEALEQREQRDAALAPERAYAALGRDQRRQAAPLTDNGDASFLLASSHSASQALPAQALNPSTPPMPAERMAVAPPTEAISPAANAGEAARTGKTGGAGQGSPGGLELRSAERSFLGSPAGSQASHNDNGNGGALSADEHSSGQGGQDAAPREAARDESLKAAESGRLRRAALAYAKTAGVYAPAPYGAAFSLAV
jgi:hypothetical protein